MDEEYILMGMAGYGTPRYAEQMAEDLVQFDRVGAFNGNLHLGVDDTYLKDNTVSEEQNNFDIAASAQELVEDLITDVIEQAAEFGYSSNLVYGGGVALNCTANRLLGDYFNSIWIMPNPGDAGSSLGCAALVYGKQLDWQGPYLGTNIPGEYPVNNLINELSTTKIAGVASGRAEFGPRALGNRSLLADPTGTEIKDKVNEIKKRQKFRPFAPVILEEHASKFFELPAGFASSPYMQVTAKCKLPQLYPAIIHVDGTSRVQTVPKDSKSGIRQLLEAWYAKTGVPMLLNTSLNIRGEPMVNDRSDADRFEAQYGVKVYS
jgi:carbamoyltransferase